jgi:hypothetical protein
MGDGRSDVGDGAGWRAGVESRRHAEALELLRAEVCTALLGAGAGTTREEVLESCGVTDAGAYEFLAGHVPGRRTESLAEGREPVVECGTRAMGLGGFRWLPGMRLLSRARVLTVEAGIGVSWLGSEGGWEPSADRVVDVDDAGTGGCLLSLLEGARASQVSDSRWLVSVVGPSHMSQGEGSTLGRACVSAAAALGSWEVRSGV